jgi:hypothetical protein
MGSSSELDLGTTFVSDREDGGERDVPGALVICTDGLRLTVDTVHRVDGTQCRTSCQSRITRIERRRETEQ